MDFFVGFLTPVCRVSGKDGVLSMEWKSERVICSEYAGEIQPDELRHVTIVVVILLFSCSLVLNSFAKLSRQCVD